MSTDWSPISLIEVGEQGTSGRLSGLERGEQVRPDLGHGRCSPATT